MKNTKKNILFIKLSNASFITQDEIILKKNFNVTTYFYGTNKGLKAIQSLIRVFFYLFVNIWKFSIVYIWFADYHSVFPALFTWVFKKKTIIVLGGFDVAKIPEHNYGGHMKPIRSFFIKASCYFSYKLLAVSEFVKQSSQISISSKMLFKTEVICNAIDTHDFRNLNRSRKNQIIYVSAAEDLKRAQIKGIDRLLHIAQLLPEFTFILVGVSDTFLKQEFEIRNIANLRTIPFVKKDKLISLYNESKVVLQLSIIESFGVAVIEAMSCGCVPVVSNIGGLKEVVSDDNGYKVDRMNDIQICDSILNAIDSFEEKSPLLHDYVSQKFSVQSREKALIKVIDA